MRADVVIIGAGLAGASTAYHLTRAGVRDVLLLEREPVPGAHASGRNAGLIRVLIEDPAVGALADRGARVLAEPPPELAAGGPLVRPTGSLLLCGPAVQAKLARSADAAGARRVGATEARALAPELAGAPIDVCYLTARDGVADIHAILTGYLRAATAAGARLETSCEAAALEMSGGRISAVRTSSGRVETETVVDAGGAWAGSLLRAAGLAAPPLAPFRRHLFQSGPAPRDPARPWVWDVENGFYFRAEGNGYLLSACDQEPHPPAAPAADPARAAELAGKLARLAPALADLTIARSWACLRTFVPDGRFLLGPDPRIPGYHYAAALGGHGVTTSFEVGRIVAAGIAHRADPPAEHAPARLLACQPRP